MFCTLVLEVVYTYVNLEKNRYLNPNQIQMQFNEKWSAFVNHALASSVDGGVISVLNDIPRILYQVFRSEPEETMQDFLFYGRMVNL